jgi:O-antigen ligase
MNGETIGFDTQIDGAIWHFTNQLEDNSYYYLNKYGRYDKIIMAQSAVFNGYESYASGRGYIWSRTIPLLKNKIILGSGADTFVLAFPQQDYVNLKNYGYGTSLITKPHSLYLQIGIQTGVISLLAFLIFYIMYFILSFKLYINCKYDNNYSKVGVAIFVGTFGYMISGISNDSCITVAPIFWALLGIGIAMNKKAKEMQKAIEK